ncbi:TPA: type II toxin-antitoxin system HicB family antitoxin [Klebsiella pneumoniae]|nr:type II toxin-antitoxin system HicB family antitoxin [Klebsiella pneumoniae]HBX2738440.1 type II toxin-antitoxin system HicB family antitoxin [Klebsiella pneumoniae]HBY1859744.1 type II toxin-antitoxin system HicB family antitoxin [Klebsiella pneumoniae]HEE1144969.1 type II toxin-antitoxin system HicB family antitoxin [Klebsiella pneumoniae]HEE1248615.1 type II toxin-antitoxin system HicB family antitoxin [Klebsiella pneumoniae]
MKFPVYINQAENGDFSGFVPDVVGCYFAGDSIDDAIIDAKNSLETYFEYISEKGVELPKANTVNDHFNDDGCTGGSWAYVDIDLTKFEGKIVKLNITLPKFLLERIDSFVAKHGEYGSRSGFIAELARKELTKHG